jgi:hypothetical protein
VEKNNWPKDTIDRLSESANALFIWAQTACKFILDGYDRSDRLRQVFDSGSPTEAYSQLNLLYTTVVSNSTGDSEDNTRIVRQCLGAIIASSTRTPLPVSSLGGFLQEIVSPDILKHVVKSLGSVLYIDGGRGGAVRVYHPSFADYLAIQSRSKLLYVDVEEHNAQLGRCCLNTMMKGLKFNICELETSYMLNKDLPALDSRVASSISALLSYSCIYWVSHTTATPDGALGEPLYDSLFVPTLLYWLKVLSLLEMLKVAPSGLLDLNSWLPTRPLEGSKSVDI